MQVVQGAAAARKIRKGVFKEVPILRGRHIEDDLGHNLPSNFPTIDKYDDVTGKVTSIKSADLRLKSYRNPKNLKRKLEKDITKLGGFNGRRWAGVNVPSPSSRSLQFVIPARGATLRQRRVLWQAKRYAKDRGVKLEIIRVP